VADDSPYREILVVANRTAATPDLLAEIERRATERPTVFTLLVPDVPKAKDWALPEAVAALRRAASGPARMQTARVSGRLGGPDPFESVRAALAEQRYDEVIISTLPVGRSRWLRRELPQRVRELGVPVTVVTAPQEAKLGLKDLPMSGPS
jgi:hypothetical protein